METDPLPLLSHQPGRDHRQGPVLPDPVSQIVNVPEVRFLLAAALKQTGRNADALQQVLLLLQSQQENVGKDPESWAYWQRRAGNEIANQLYREGTSRTPWKSISVWGTG